MTRYFIIIFTLLSTASVAQDIPENNPSSENALVYFIRGKANTGSATGFSALIDEERVCNVSNRRFSAHRIAPGSHEFKVQFEGKKGKKKAEVIEIDVDAGSTYYIQMVIDAGFMVNDLTPVEITRNSALRLIDDDKIQMDKNCAEVSQAAMNSK